MNNTTKYSKQIAKVLSLSSQCCETFCGKFDMNSYSYICKECPLKGICNDENEIEKFLLREES